MAFPTAFPTTQLHGSRQPRQLSAQRTALKLSGFMMDPYTTCQPDGPSAFHCGAAAEGFNTHIEGTAQPRILQQRALVKALQGPGAVHRHNRPCRTLPAPSGAYPSHLQAPPAPPQGDPAPQVPRPRPLHPRPPVPASPQLTALEHEVNPDSTPTQPLLIPNSPPPPPKKSSLT